MWIRGFVCEPCSVPILSVPQRWQAAPPCWRRQRHLDSTPAIIGSMAVKLDGLRLLISSPLFSSAPNLLCSFHICCLSASTRYCFPPSSSLIRPICFPTPPTGHFYIPAARRSGWGVFTRWRRMNSSCSLCRGVTRLPPSNLSLIVMSISEPRLLNLESVCFSTLAARLCFIHDSWSLQRTCVWRGSTMAIDMMQHWLDGQWKEKRHNEPPETVTLRLRSDEEESEAEGLRWANQVPGAMNSFWRFLMWSLKLKETVNWREVMKLAVFHLFICLFLPEPS